MCLKRTKDNPCLKDLTVQMERKKKKSSNSRRGRGLFLEQRRKVLRERDHLLKLESMGEGPGRPFGIHGSWVPTGQ